VEFGERKGRRGRRKRRGEKERGKKRKEGGKEPTPTTFCTNRILGLFAGHIKRHSPP